MPNVARKYCQSGPNAGKPGPCPGEVAEALKPHLGNQTTQQARKYDAAAAPATAPGGANTFAPSLDKKTPRVEFDKDEFHTLEGIPVFDEHSGSDEGLDLDFTPEVLSQIVDACNRRIADTGDYPVITDGHTHDDPSLPAPDTLGFASNFRLGEIGREKPRKAIYCDMHIYRSKMERAKQLPRRSIELWPDMVADPIALKKDTASPIDSVALLGSERPARDLGLLFAKKSGRLSKYRYEVQDYKEPMNPEEIVKACLDALQQTPEFAFLRELMEQPEAVEAAPDASPEQYAENDKPEEDKVEERGDGAEEDDDEKLEPAKLRMQRDQERRRYAKLENEYKSLHAKVATLERNERLASRKADLLGLEGEGIVFDMAEELDLVADLEPAKYGKHLAHMRKRYQRSPVGVSVKPASVPVEGGQQKLEPTVEDVYTVALKRARELYKS